MKSLLAFFNYLFAFNKEKIDSRISEKASFEA
jgi:hypothetical protein